MSFNTSLCRAVKPLFALYAEKNDAVEVVCLATTDGFPVHNCNRGAKTFEPDTLAAASSTLYSVSNAVAGQILAKRFKVAFIEAEQGNVAFVALVVHGRDFVLAMSATQQMNIAQLRLLINRLAGEIRALNIE